MMISQEVCLLIRFSSLYNLSFLNEVMYKFFRLKSYKFYITFKILAYSILSQIFKCDYRIIMQTYRGSPSLGGWLSGAHNLQQT